MTIHNFIPGDTHAAVAPMRNFADIRFFLICGAPTAGKSEVQRLLTKLFGVEPIDDAAPIRQAAKLLYGLSEEDVSTQKGKSKIVQIGQREVEVRTLLGELGAHVEKDDPLFKPRRARERVLREMPGKKVSFGSVRLNQASLFTPSERLVIEVTRPGVVSQNAFDGYDREFVDFTIENRFDPANKLASREALQANLLAAVNAHCVL